MTLKRARAGLPDPLAVTMRFTVIAFLIVGIRGHWGNSGWFWALLAALVSATAVVACCARERSHLERQGALASAVRKRTADLERERRRERERNRILEMLVSNVPLESVLDEVLQGIRSQCPGALCAILRKSADHSLPGAGGSGRAG